jgi:hypothetical protein
MLLSYLMAVSFTDTIEVNLTTIEKLVDYSLSMPHSGIIPSASYNGSINASFAIPDSALAGLEGRQVSIRVTASAQENSSIYFPGEFGTRSKNAEAYLRCDVENGTCANTSVLWAAIPVAADAAPNSSELSKITLKSEVADGVQFPSLPSSAEGLINSIKGLVELNTSTDALGMPKNAATQGEAFLDSLKPEGDSHDPIKYLKENSLLSMAAIAIVIVVTGAYLLNVKD